MRFRSFTIGLSLIVAACLSPSSRAETSEKLVRDNDRIVFVGDSITGQGGNLVQGWTHLMSEALAQSHPTGAPTLIALGGSGQTVGSWQNIEKKSREAEVTLDVKGVDVKTTLDQHADVVVIMLGMNDVLSPSLSADEAAFDAWSTRYQQLIASLRERTTPRLLALATVPVCTEDEQSPKNQAIAALTKRLTAIAVEEKAVVLPVHQAMLDMLAQGRKVRPDFHVTTDFVHPNGPGHLAIAQGMLNGLAEAGAAQLLSEKYGAKFLGQNTEDLPTLSYQVEYVPAPLNNDTQTCKVRYWWSSALPAKQAAPTPQVRLIGPADWKVSPASITAIEGEFTLTGPFDHLKSRLSLEGNSGGVRRKTEVSLPAPWLIGTTNLRQMTWGAGNNSFDPAKARLAADDVLTRGESWGQPLELAPERPMNMKWSRHNPTVNYLGGAQPGSVDMAAVTFFNSFEVGYGARWIYSERDRTVQLKLGSQSFGGNDYLALWMNGETIYGGYIMADRGKTVDANLHKGWNVLVFKSNHLQWQWHFSVDLVETPGDDLSDLRVSIVPHKP